MVVYPLSCRNIWQLGEGGSECFFPQLASLLSISQAIPKPKVLNEIYDRLNMSLVRSVARAIMGREAVQGEVSGTVG